MANVGVVVDQPWTTDFASDFRLDLPELSVSR
jgi:hypothetical protein